MTFQPALYDGKLGYRAIDARQMLSALLADQQGVFGSGNLLCAAGSGFNTAIAAGRGSVLNSFTTTQGGLYLVRNDASVSVQHDASDPTNGRYDVVGVKVYDSETGGDSSDIPSPYIVKGTPAGSPVVPTVFPNNFMPLANVLVPAASTLSSSFTYTDVRVVISSTSGLAGQVLNKPTGAMSHPSLALEAVRQPSTTRPTLVIATLTAGVTSLDLQEVLMDSSNPPTNIIAQVGQGSGSLSPITPVTFIVPTSYYYKIHQVSGSDGGSPYISEQAL